MIVLGLTGSIGMGKSTAAAMFRRLRVPVFDSDACVHRLQAPGGAALPAIAAAFPGVVHDGVLDRQKLGAAVFGNPARLATLEAIVHPLVRARQNHFLRIAALHRVPLVVLDVPLLFEGSGWRLCDVTAVVSAPASLQRHRVMQRAGMSAEKLDRILGQQMPDAEKRRRADVVIPSGRGRRATWLAIRALVKALSPLPRP